MFACAVFDGGRKKSDKTDYDFCWVLLLDSTRKNFIHGKSELLKDQEFDSLFHGCWNYQEGYKI